METLNLLNQFYFANYDYNAIFSCGLIVGKKKKEKKRQAFLPIFSNQYDSKVYQSHWLT